MREKCYDPETASSSGATHVPSQPSTLPSPRPMPCRDAGSPHVTRNITGTSGNVCERQPARQGRTSTFFNNCKNLASSSQELGPDTEGKTKRPKGKMRRESQNSSIPVPRFRSGGGLLYHSSGTHSHSGMKDFPILPISELHLGKFLTLLNFKAGRSTSKLEYVENQKFLTSLCTGSKKLR